METFELGQKEKNSKKKASSQRILLAVICLLCVVTCLSSIAVLVMMLRENSQIEPVSVAPETETTAYTQEELQLLLADAEQKARAQAEADFKSDLKETFVGGESVVAKLRQLYPEDLIFYDSDHYAFYPILADVPKHAYVSENFTQTENGEIIYHENGVPVSVKGIDVSKYQGEIDWNKVAATGVEYAILRAGIRGYGTGAIVLDECFEQNLKGATAAGIDVGVYFFTQAISEAEAIEEAQFVLNAIAGYTITYPIIIDVEVLYDSEARTYQLTQKERTDYCIAFCETVKNAGYTPMIYGNLKSFADMLDLTRLVSYEKWFAFYDNYIYFPYEVSTWQYTDKATVDGIEGPVDLNITMQRKWGAN